MNAELDGSYSNGGLLPNSTRTTAIHPDECLLGTDLRCQRPDHPTATSDCVTQGWIRRRQ